MLKNVAIKTKIKNTKCYNKFDNILAQQLKLFNENYFSKAFILFVSFVSVEISVCLEFYSISVISIN